MGSMSRVRKRVALRRKLHILRTLTTSKSVKRSCIIVDAFLYIHILKLRLEAAKRDYLNLIKHFLLPKDVKVEKNEEGGFLIRVTCEKGGDTLVSVLQVFEEMGLDIVQARVSCNCNLFTMEATAIAAQNQDLDVRDVTQAILNATTQKQDVEIKAKSII